MNGIAGFLLIQQIQAEQRQRDEETEEQLREQENLKRRRQAQKHEEEPRTKELVILQNGEEVPAHQVLDADTTVIVQDPCGNFVRSINHE